jgi:hypothetical protein
VINLGLWFFPQERREVEWEKERQPNIAKNVKI